MARSSDDAYDLGAGAPAAGAEGGALRARLWFLGDADAFARRFVLAEVLGAPRSRRPPGVMAASAPRAALGPGGRLSPGIGAGTGTGRAR